MSNKPGLATAFNSLLLFSAIAGVQLVRLAAANFTPAPPIPPPTISILWPENKTYMRAPMEYGYALIAVMWVSLVAVAGYLSLKRKKLGEGK